MPVSEAALDAAPLVRLAYPSFTGHLGMIAPRGATFVDGVAQNGVTEAAAARLCGCIGPALVIVGPWEASADSEASASAEPPTAPAPSIKPAAKPSRSR
jgi:hypothetical protein